VVEFSDFECPFCIRHASSTYPKLREREIVPGRAQYAFLNHPLSIHRDAELLATAAICSDNNGSRFWAMHDRLFAEKPRTSDGIKEIARQLGLPLEQFEVCLTAPSTHQRLEQEIGIAEKMGLKGTPAFALGLLDDSGRVSVKQILRGAQPIEVFDRAIQELQQGGKDEGRRAWSFQQLWSRL
jgi:protein-disulfide isomerase